jgi:hypothetical protein
VGFAFKQSELDAGKIRFVATSTAPFVTDFDFTLTDSSIRLWPSPQREGGLYANETTTTLEQRSFFGIDMRDNRIAVATRVLEFLRCGSETIHQEIIPFALRFVNKVPSVSESWTNVDAELTRYEAVQDTMYGCGDAVPKKL